MYSSHVLRYPTVWLWRHRVLFLATIGYILGGWTTVELYESVKLLMAREHVSISWLGVFSIAVFIFYAFFSYEYRKELMQPHTRYLEKIDMPKKKILVLFLSKIQPDLEKTGGMPNDYTILSFKNLTRDLEVIKEMKDTKKIRWLWEMPLRAIAHHLPKLQKIIVVCSEGNISQGKLFHDICRRWDGDFKGKSIYLLAKQKESERPVLLDYQNYPASNECEGWDFENFDEITEALRTLAKILQKDKDMVIDITGGQKTTSVAAISTTINKGIQAQYVQTEGTNRVIGYDVVYEYIEAAKIEI